MGTPYDRPARPWDIFNKNLGKVGEEVAKERLAMCTACEHFIRLTTQCKECGCFMSAKTKLPNASCPVGKWSAIHVSYKEEE